MQTHEWTFVAAGETEGDHPGLIAVCSVCGVVRSIRVVLGGSEDRISLEGRCPGRAVDRTVRGTS